MENLCNNCNKIFKNINKFKIHINEQKCYDKDNITFCKLCNFTYSNNYEYKKHCITLQHINNVNYNNILLNNNIPNILNYDPYLTQNDINQINKKTPHKFSIVFNNNTIKTINNSNNLLDMYHYHQDNNQINNDVSENHHINNNISHYQSNKCTEQINNDVSDNQNNDGKICNDIVENLYNNQNNKVNVQINNADLIPSIKQSKILNILSKINNIDDGRHKFLRILTEKMNIEDYYKFQYFIKTYDNLTSEFKNLYLLILDEFIKMLIKNKVKGDTLFNNKDITNIVLNITS